MISISKKSIAVISLFLLVVSFIVIAATGSRYTDSYDLTWVEFNTSASGMEGLSVTAEDPGIVEISNIRVEGNLLKFDLKALNRGKTFLQAVNPSDSHVQLLHRVYVHRFSIITTETYFGNCTGGFMIPLSMLIIMLLLFADRLTRLKTEAGENLYSYGNIINFGLLVYMTSLSIKLVVVTLSFSGIDFSIASVLSSAEGFAYVVFPAAFVMFVLISLSNLNLMRKEGVNWHNMLGFILGLCLCLLTVLPEKLYHFLLTHQIIDIFNERGVLTQLYAAFEYSVFFVLAYLECILLGTIVFSIRAARHIPTFDKDYILILGSWIRADGTLPPLLRSRADTAVDFAEKQKKASGKDIIFVPSGGKGEDEVMAEADAIGSYLKSRGLPEERILPENQSCNTYENIRNSMRIIESSGGNCSPNVAFSTTNYHVFRAGLIASELGYRMEGIGSPTKRYFWINAFIREFIATLVSEKKHHLKVIAALLFGVFVMTAVRYLTIIL